MNASTVAARLHDRQQQVLERPARGHDFTDDGAVLGVAVDHAERVTVWVSLDHEVRIVGIVAIDSYAPSAIRRPLSADCSSSLTVQRSRWVRSSVSRCTLGASPSVGTVQDYRAYQRPPVPHTRPVRLSRSAPGRYPGRSGQLLWGADNDWLLRGIGRFHALDRESGAARPGHLIADGTAGTFPCLV